MQGFAKKRVQDGLEKKSQMIILHQLISIKIDEQVHLKCKCQLFSIEYDSLQDTSESQASQIKVLNKDLEQSVQECIRTKEKLAATEVDVSEKTSRLGSVTTELGESQSRVKVLEEEKQRQEKAIAKLSADNKELVKLDLFIIRNLSALT